jgi:hypothetical protein
MADFTKGSAADMASGNPGLNMGTTGSMHDIEWDTEDQYWQVHYASRPYVQADRPYTYYRPAFHYGAHVAADQGTRGWDDVESELARGWAGARGASQVAWDDVKHAVRDAWDRVVRARHP